jgi:glycosyltransferase involved in cell wall biosynthesis
MKLSLALIVKNEALTLPKLFLSVKDIFDEIVVVDTGSTDNTKAVCEEWCGEKLKWDTFEWVDDFASARQKSFDLCTGDWIVWADADDALRSASELRSIAEKCEKDNVNAVVFPYHYCLDEYGNTTVLQMRERLIKNNGVYKWIGKLHETLVPQNKLALAVSLTSVEWVHNTTPERIEESKKRNVRVLEKALDEEVLEDKVDPRTVYNLGNAYFTLDAYKEAVGCYLKYIPMSGWIEERYLARHRASLGFLYSKDYGRALEMAFTALEEKPEYPDAKIDIGKIYFEKNDFEKALYWFKEALSSGIPEKLPVFNPMDYSANLALLIGNCYVQMNDYLQAKPYFETFMSYYPKSEHGKKILGILEEGMKEREIVKSLSIVSKEIGSPEFWDLIPTRFLEYPELLHEKNKIVKRASTSGKDMAIYCGNCVVPWDGNSDKEGGIGGSEEAVINITKRLAKLGWNITVYGKPRKVGIYDGVLYEHFTSFNPNDALDVFISWRMPGVFKVKVNATRKYCWLHDVTPEDAFSVDILNNLDKILVLSDYHRSIFPNIPDEKFMKTGNGIDPDQFTPGMFARIKNRCIYTSSPDRGLEVLLKIWPKIIEQIPNAQLHWYYGWEVFDKLHEGNQEMAAYKARIKDLLKQPGVYEGGRIDHLAVAEEYQKAEFWLYPTEFTETFCITAAKAQAAGAIPITTTVAALDETVKFGHKFDVSDMYTSEEAQQAFVDKTIEYMKADHDRRPMQDWACEHFDWQKVAECWHNDLLK